MEAKAAIQEFKVPSAEIVQHSPNPYDETPAVTPMDLIQLAVDKGADIDKLEKLMDLKLRWDAAEAKKAYHAAMNAFKADPPEIIKNKAVDYTTKSGVRIAYKHATLDQVCGAVTERLSKYGISHRWKVEQKEGLIKVTCVLTHEAGHSEETTMSAGPDDSGGKNNIQAIASSTNYLQRYTLLAGTGMAAAGEDNDGRGALPQMEKLQQYLDAIAICHNQEILKTTFNEAFKEAAKLQDTAAMKKLFEAKDARRIALAKDEAA